jgi:dUTP pyrophosphatase
MYILYIVPANAAAGETYSAAATAYNARRYEDRDAGFDLFSATTTVRGGAACTRISQQVVAGFYDTKRRLFRAFWLLPRSSVSRTPLRLANSVGLIDAGYRGDIMAAVDPVGTEESATFEVRDGDRYFQLASPDLLPWDEVRVVDAVPGGDTLRGVGGFGSTGRNGAAATDASAGVGSLCYFA